MRPQERFHAVRDLGRVEGVQDVKRHAVKERPGPALWRRVHPFSGFVGRVYGAATTPLQPRRRVIDRDPVQLAHNDRVSARQGKDSSGKSCPTAAV
jgi:hypothetical protein